MHTGINVRVNEYTRTLGTSGLAYNFIRYSLLLFISFFLSIWPKIMLYYIPGFLIAFFFVWNRRKRKDIKNFEKIIGYFRTETRTKSMLSKQQKVIKLTLTFPLSTCISGRSFFWFKKTQKLVKKDDDSGKTYKHVVGCDSKTSPWQESTLVDV